MQDYPRLYWKNLQGVPSPDLQMLEVHYDYEVNLFVNIWIYPLDTERKLNADKTFKGRPGRHVQFTRCVQGVNVLHIYPIYSNIS